MRICVVQTLLIAALFGDLASADENITASTSATIAQLQKKTGKEGSTNTLLGYENPGDGGGGLFYWSSNAPKPIDGGTIVRCNNGGAWVRIFNGPVHAAWFGVLPTAERDTLTQEEVDRTTHRLEQALHAAAGDTLRFGQGTFYLSKTLIIPPNTLITGAGPQDIWTRSPGGTTIRPYGPGKAQLWQDTGVKENDMLRPLFVCGGSNVRFREIGLLTQADEKSGSTAWDVGILLPATKRCSLDHVSIRGYWQVAACLLDATWSDRHKSMIALHKGRITPSSMNECTILRCFLSGKWGVMIRGADKRVYDPRDFRDYDKTGMSERWDEWIWSYGGTSDIEIISCRIEGKAPKSLQHLDGGAFYSDAPMVNGAAAGQGHRIIGCNLRTNTRYMVKLGSSNRDTFIGCYFEGGWCDRQPNGKCQEAPSFMTNDAEHTGQTRFIDCRFTTCDIKSEWNYKKTHTWP